MRTSTRSTCTRSPAPAGGATWVEFTADVPGDYLLVDHAITRAVDKGALAMLTVTGEQDPSIFEAHDGLASEDGHASEGTDEAPGTYEVACHVPGHDEAGMTAVLEVQ